MFEIYILPAEWAKKQKTAQGCQAVRHKRDSRARTHLAQNHESVRYPGLAPLRRHHVRGRSLAAPRPRQLATHRRSWQPVRRLYQPARGGAAAGLHL